MLGLLTLLLLWFVVQQILDERALEQPADARMLFIGNSFTKNNELDQLVAQLANELGPEWDDVFATRVAPGGYKLVEHLGDLALSLLRKTIPGHLKVNENGSEDLPKAPALAQFPQRQ